MDETFAVWPTRCGLCASKTKTTVSLLLRNASLRKIFDCVFALVKPVISYVSFVRNRLGNVNSGLVRQANIVAQVRQRAWIQATCPFSAEI